MSYMSRNRKKATGDSSLIDMHHKRHHFYPKPKEAHDYEKYDELFEKTDDQAEHATVWKTHADC
jgi:hypothetical protein